ncbi:MAG: hypothetical protein IT330_00345 [Anaerolineae bacterium]|nr:hypothetical protein [Anaerolineae bacterium]
MADVLAELEQTRQQVRRTEEQLAALGEQTRLLQESLRQQREELWLRAQSEEAERAVLEAALEWLAQRIPLTPIPGWRYCFNALQNRLISLDYLPDTEGGPERTLAIRLPFNLLWFMRSRSDSLEIFVLGHPERLLALPGAMLWDWIGVRWQRWQTGVFAFTFRWREEPLSCQLVAITQHRPRGRGEQSNVCLMQAVDVSEFLNWEGQLYSPYPRPKM